MKLWFKWAERIIVLTAVLQIMSLGTVAPAAALTWNLENFNFTDGTSACG